MYSVVYVPGVFDLLHRGHLALLRRAREMSRQVIVGVVSDAGAEAYKRRPVQDEETRLAVIRALRSVDFAFLQPTTDPTPVLEMLRTRGMKPGALLHGSDWDRLLEGQETLERLGIEFVILPYTPGMSTSALVSELVERANAPAAEVVELGMAVTR